MAKAHVRLPSIGVSVIDLGPDEIAEIPEGLSSHDVKLQTKAAFGLAIGQILKRGGQHGLTTEDFFEIMKKREAK